MDKKIERKMATPKASEFKELKIESMIDIDNSSSSSNTEIWLVQWPFDHQTKDKSNNLWPKLADFDGQEGTVKLNADDDDLGTIQSSTGKSYELRSMNSYTPEEIVFLSSTSDIKMVGNISRHVSLIHYPEPSELQKTDKDLERKLGLTSSSSSRPASSRRTATPTQTIRSGAGPTPTSTSRKRSSTSVMTGSSEPSKSKKRKHTNEVSGSRGHSDIDSGRGHSTVTTSGGSLNQSEERKSKKKKNQG